MIITSKVGEIALDSLEGVKTLSGMADNGNYDTLQFPIGTFYQAPVDLNFYIAQLVFNGSVANSKVEVGYADDSVDNSAVAPTNPVLMTEQLKVADANLIYASSVVLQVPFSKYPFIISDTGTVTAVISGVEWL